MAAAVGAQPMMNPEPLIEILRLELPRYAQLQSLNRSVHVLDSSAFINMTLTSLKNLPACIGVASGITARLRYLESTLMSLVSLVHNVVMAVIFTVVAGVTFGQFNEVNDYFKREWIHTALSMGSLIIGFLGMVIPLGGVIVNTGLVLGAGTFAAAHLGDAEEELVELTKDIYRRNRDGFANASLALVGNDERRFDVLFRPVLSEFNRNMEGMQSFAEIVALIGGGICTIIRNVDLGGEQNALPVAVPIPQG